MVSVLQPGSRHSWTSGMGRAAYAARRPRARETAWLSGVVGNQGAAELRLPPDELDAIPFEGFSVRARCS